jgi:clan AA aspartic protease (TIGR02281 family)
MKRAIAMLAVALAAETYAQADRKCELRQIAQWPLREHHYRPVVDATINGQKVGVLIDTGAGVSLIERSAARKLGLKTMSVRGFRVFGVGGESQAEQAAIDELKIGDATYRNWVALVAGETESPGDITLVLGYDFLHQMDIELDLPQKAMRLFEPRGCERASLAYWSNDAVMLPLESGKKLLVTVRINGKPLVAELDSGTTFSSLSLEGALQVGVTPETPGLVSGGCSTGFGRFRVDKWIAPFESFAIGDELIRSPKMRFGDLWQYTKREETGSFIARRIADLPDMLLGADFLRAHRVYIANSQGRLYFSYVGGTVFPATPGKPCSERKD